MKHRIVNLVVGLLLICFFTQAQESEEPTTFGPAYCTIGEDMPDAIMQDTLRQTHRLADYTGQGKDMVPDH